MQPTCACTEMLMRATDRRSHDHHGSPYGVLLQRPVIYAERRAQPVQRRKCSNERKSYTEHECSCCQRTGAISESKNDASPEPISVAGVCPPESSSKSAIAAYEPHSEPRTWSRWCTNGPPDVRSRIKSKWKSRSKHKYQSKCLEQETSSESDQGRRYNASFWGRQDKAES